MWPGEIVKVEAAETGVGFGSPEVEAVSTGCVTLDLMLPLSEL